MAKTSVSASNHENNQIIGVSGVAIESGEKMAAASDNGAPRVASRTYQAVNIE
jgi:hypothetical protein